MKAAFGLGDEIRGRFATRYSKTRKQAPRPFEDGNLSAIAPAAFKGSNGDRPGWPTVSAAVLAAVGVLMAGGMMISTVANAVDIHNADNADYVIMVIENGEGIDTAIAAGETKRNICENCEIWLDSEVIEAGDDDVVVITNETLSKKGS
jgi:hypothetical protein